MSLEEAIRSWDGKAVGPIAGAYAAYSDWDEFVPIVVEYLERKEGEVGASWLLKNYLESGNEVDGKTATAIYRLLPGLEKWEARLQVLQCIPYIPISKASRLGVEAFLRAGIRDINKFVRAWSYNGFCELAQAFPEYRAEVRQLFDTAMNEETASVRARIRNIRKKGAW